MDDEAGRRSAAIALYRTKLLQHSEVDAKVRRTCPAPRRLPPSAR